MYMRKLIRTILTNGGYHIVGEAADGKTAMELAMDLSPDIITLDNVLPDMLGLDAIIQIKHSNPSTKVMMVTPIGQLKMVDEARLSGIDEYLLKPFTPSQILQKIEKLCA